MTEAKDRLVEEETIKSALKLCGYPVWSFQKVKDKMSKPKVNTKSNKQNTNAEQSRAYVTLPYIQGVTEHVQRILRGHRINSSVKPHTNLRKILVHPKDKQKTDDKTGVVYEISCASCDKTYIGETARKFGTRRDEHKSEAVKHKTENTTRAARHASQSIEFDSAVAEHSVKENHVIKWDDGRIITREDNRSARQVRESIWIRRNSTTGDTSKHLMTSDEGAHNLSHLYDPLIRKSS